MRSFLDGLKLATFLNKHILAFAFLIISFVLSSHFRVLVIVVSEDLEDEGSARQDGSYDGREHHTSGDSGLVDPQYRPANIKYKRVTNTFVFV